MIYVTMMCSSQCWEADKIAYKFNVCTLNSAPVATNGAIIAKQKCRNIRTAFQVDVKSAIALTSHTFLALEENKSAKMKYTNALFDKMNTRIVLFYYIKWCIKCKKHSIFPFAWGRSSLM